ncbi:MAG: hypothetical protein ACO2ZZ_06570 [Cyclobacteriaceae bacterium]
MFYLLGHTKIWVLFALFAASITNVQAQRRFEGYTFDDQKVSLPFTHLINLVQSVGTVSGSNGFFSIQAEVGDSVRLSFIGYKKLVLVMTEEMLDREVNITLQPDYIELPSIWVFSNPKYKVPKKPILPSFRMGPLPETKNQKNIQPGDVTFKLIDKMEIAGITVPILSPSITLHGPFTYFTKEEREKRKAEEAYLSTYETLSFAKLMALKQTRDLLKNRYSLDDSELDQLIVMLNRELPLIQKIQEPTKIFASVDQYIGRKRADIDFLFTP